MKTEALRTYITWAPTQAFRYFSLLPFSNFIKGFQKCFLFFENSVKKISYQMLRHAKQIKKGAALVHGGAGSPELHLLISLSPGAPLWKPRESSIKTTFPNPQFPYIQQVLWLFWPLERGCTLPVCPQLHPTSCPFYTLTDSTDKYKYLLTKPSLHTACTNQLKVTVYKNQCLVCGLGFCGL